MRESSGRQLANRSVGFSLWEAERTGPASLEDKETRVPGNTVACPGPRAQRPPRSAPTLRGAEREAPGSRAPRPTGGCL